MTPTHVDPLRPGPTGPASPDPSRPGPGPEGPGAEPHAAAVRLLSGWDAPDGEQDGLRREYLGHLSRHPDGLWRDGPPQHLTASCFVLDPTATHVLLTFHRKGRFWVQFGGHCEMSDADLPGTAAREAREESGVPSLVPDAVPVDLHRHVLAESFGRCREHLDVGFVAVAAAGTRVRVSEESEDVAWWPVAHLPAGTVPDLPQRLRYAVGRVLGGPPPAG